MEKRLERIEEMIGTLIQMVGRNNAKLDDIAQDVNQMKIDITSIKDGQERQDRILESLAVKSLEQDSYIRDFKRKI